jgi:hypothetical protein
MSFGRAKLGILLLTVCAAGFVPSLLANKKDKNAVPSSANEQKRALHALNRLTFGPRPGDIQHVMAIGVDKGSTNNCIPKELTTAPWKHGSSLSARSA